MNNKTTYHQQVSYCGKPKCRKCREGTGHGPYWYAYKTENGRTTRTYIGKTLPANIQAELQAAQQNIAIPALDTLTTRKAPLLAPRVASITATESASALLRVTLLGQLRLERRSQRQWHLLKDTAWQQAPVRSLFAYILCQPGRTVKRDAALRDLWPQKDDSASNLLDHALSQLQQLLTTPQTNRNEKSSTRQGRATRPAPPLLKVTANEITLAGQAHLWVDADAFEQLLNALATSTNSQQGPEREQLLVQAVTLYNGDLLPEERYGTWVIERRQRLRRAWLSLLLELADLSIARQDASSALTVLDRVLAIEPTNEEAVQRCIYLLAHLKRRGEALRAYTRLEQLLKRDYNRKPNQVTRDLFEAVKRGGDPRPLLTFTRPQSPAESPIASQAPTPESEPQSTLTPPEPLKLHIGRPGQSPLVGRDSELEILYNMLVEIEHHTTPLPLGAAHSSPIPLDTLRRPQCVFLMGDSGIGKTRLAEELARQASRQGWTIIWSRGYQQESGIPYHIWTDALRKIITETGLLPNLFGSFAAHMARTPSSTTSSLPGVTLQSSRLALQDPPSASSTTRGRRRPPRETQVIPEAALSPASQWQPLTTLLPELASLFPDPRLSLLSSYISPEQEQLRLHETVRDLLFAASDSSPILVVLDDIQWTDASSGDLLGYLARHVTGRPLFFLATCRDSELPQQPPHPLRVLVAHMHREHSVRTLQLGPLSGEDIARLVSHLPEERVQLIQAQAAGNPFFAEELARSKPPILPSTITAALEHRIQNLSISCQQLLGSAAVLGGSFEFSTLYTMESATNPIDEETVIEQLEEALQSGVLNEESIGSRAIYHFWHPMLVSYLYEHISATRRARLHRRAAHVLQEIYEGREDEIAATIAHHLVQGGAPSELIVYYARLAAERAYTLSAYAEAERHYRLALEYLDHPPTPSLASNGSATMSDLPPQYLAELENALTLRVGLLERLAECEIIRGRFNEARTLYEQILHMRDIQHPIDPYEAQKRALLWGEVGRCWRNASNTAMARTCCERGEQVLREAGIYSGPTWARLRYQQGSIYRMEGRYHEARQAAQESLAFFDSQQTIHLVGPIIQATRLERALAGDPVDLGNTHRLLGALADAEGHASEALDHLDTALFIFEQADHKRLIAHVCCDLSYVYLKKGALEEAQAALRRSLNLAQSVDDDPLISVINSNYGELHAARGEFEEAEKWYQRGLAYAQNHKDKVYISQWNSRLAALLLEQGKLQEASNRVIIALKTARTIHNNPSLGRALVSLGNHRIAQALTMETLPTIYRRLLTHAHTDLIRALALEGLETETRLRARLALAHTELLLDHPHAQEHLRAIIREARACDLAQLASQAAQLQPHSP